MITAIDNKKLGGLFILLGLSSLLAGVIFGSIGGLQYVFPSFLKEQLTFQQTRPLHVYLIISFIFSTATGCIYFILPSVAGKKLFSVKLGLVQWAMQLCILLVVIAGFFSGKFSGREYLEFPPAVSVFILGAWLLFLINFFKTISIPFKDAPVYIWMWATGILFFIITMFEAHLWLHPYFHNNIVRDLTVQWKALGSMVGSWNMLVYGTAMYVMEKITDDKNVSRSSTAFFFYFLGFTNLLFNWGHHTYIIPASNVILEVSYIISMTELLFVGKIVYSWRKSYLAAKINYHNLAFRVLSVGDFWIFLNLILAIVISVPAINYYTHGTHITVAHSMGATIGINTMLILASLLFIANEFANEKLSVLKRHFTFSLRFLNISLFIFWVSLLVSGVFRSIDIQNHTPFAILIANLKSVFAVFSIAGIFVMVGLYLMIIPLYKIFIKLVFKN